jgi:hypothetical protein
LGISRADHDFFTFSTSVTINFLSKEVVPKSRQPVAAGVLLLMRYSCAEFEISRFVPAVKDFLCGMIERFASTGSRGPILCKACAETGLNRIKPAISRIIHDVKEKISRCVLAPPANLVLANGGNIALT